LIKKVASKYDPVVVGDWLSRVEEIRACILELELDEDLVEDLDEILSRFAGRVASPASFSLERLMMWLIMCLRVFP
jgi:hypothetical protein